MVGKISWTFPRTLYTMILLKLDSEEIKLIAFKIVAYVLQIFFLNFTQKTNTKTENSFLNAVIQALI